MNGAPEVSAVADKWIYPRPSSEESIVNQPGYGTREKWECTIFSWVPKINCRRGRLLNHLLTSIDVPGLASSRYRRSYLTRIVSHGFYALQSAVLCRSVRCDHRRCEASQEPERWVLSRRKWDGSQRFGDDEGGCRRYSVRNRKRLS